MPQHQVRRDKKGRVLELCEILPRILASCTVRPNAMTFDVVESISFSHFLKPKNILFLQIPFCFGAMRR